MVKLVIDATSEITKEEAEKLGIISIPMRVSFGEEEFLTGVNLSNAEFYEKLQKSKTLPHTSQVNTDDYIKIIKPMIDAGDDVFVMALSSELSGTYNSLRLASEEINSPHLKIMDTETTTFSYAALVYQALELIKTNISLEELSTQMEDLKKKVKLYAVIDNVKYLVKGGRLSLAKGLLVGVLKIKPIVSFVNKKLKMVGKAIGFDKALKTMAGLIKNVNITKPMYYAHSNNPERAEMVKTYMEQTHGYKFDKCFEIGPVIGTHAGPNCAGVVYFEN